MPFPWLHPIRVPSHGQAAMYRRELEERAALLYRLGYPKARARARLAANVAWDFEVIGDGAPAPGAPTPSTIDQAIETIYRRGGTGSGAPTI